MSSELPAEQSGALSTEEVARDAGSALGMRLFGVDVYLGERTRLLLIATSIGVVSGLASIGYRSLIELIHGMAWGGQGTVLESITQAPLLARLLIPPAGGLLVGLIVMWVAPEAKGHGVPEVMVAVARRGGVIRPIVVLGKAFASAVCIASGGSVGREGPIVQIGAAIGSTVGQLLRMPTRIVRTCVACGAAAGIAGTFNAPIGGAFFAAEVILGQFGMEAFGALVMSSVAATVVSRAFIGDTPAFVIPRVGISSPWEMFTFGVLGILAGLAAVAYIRALEGFEDYFERLDKVPEYVKPAIGGAAMALIGLVMPQVMGVGYDSVMPLLNGQFALGLVILLFAAKLLATTLTLGSGGSGGVFAPSLLMGAALGSAVGQLAPYFVTFDTSVPGAYAIVGMGAMVAAATHTPITAILIIFEMTGDYRLILGLMAACPIAALVAQWVRRDSIYTVKLTRRGIDLRAGHEANVLSKVLVADRFRRDIEIVRRDATLDQLYHRMVSSSHYEFFVVDDQGDLVGVISVDDLRHVLPELEQLRGKATAEDLMSTDVASVRVDDSLDYVMRQMARRTHEEIAVLGQGASMKPVGTMRRDDVFRAYNTEMLKADLGTAVSASMAQAVRTRTWETVGGYVLGQLEVPPRLCGADLVELDLRRKWGVQLLLVERTDQAGRPGYSLPTRTTVMEPGDRVLVFGSRKDVRAFLDHVG